jgi:hypothetical protein
MAYLGPFGVDLQKTGELIGTSRTSEAMLRREFVMWGKGKKPPALLGGGRRTSSF